MALILVAAASEPRAIVERILAGHELACAETMARGEKFLRVQPPDLILCTIDFDESKIFEFLQLAKSRPLWRLIPFVCARVRSHVLRSPAALAAAALTSRELGAAAFLDITSYRFDPEREMRDAVERLLRSRGEMA